MKANAASYYVDSANRRTSEVPNASWTNGCNDAGSNAPGIGVCTGVPNPKDSDWKKPATNPTVVQVSQQIGKTKTGLFVKDPATAGDNEVTAFMFTTGSVAADASVGTVAGFTMRNRTGETLASGATVWAVGDQ